jgi:hypothetical protein
MPACQFCSIIFPALRVSSNCDLSFFVINFVYFVSFVSFVSFCRFLGDSEFDLGSCFLLAPVGSVVPDLGIVICF